MNGTVIVAVAVAAVLAAGWSFGRALSPRRSQLLAPGVTVHGRLPVSVVIPARNEAATLPVLLASLAACTAAPAEVIVVDDASTDATAQIAALHGAVVVAAPPLPTGWTGKNWACHTGAQHSREPRLLFLDADTCLAPDAVGALLAAHDSTGRGLLSVQPFHRTGRLVEDLSALFNAVSLFGTGAFSLRPPRSLRMAFGPCLVIDRDDYDRIGGHAAVRAEVVEDIALAERCAQAGLAVSCRLGGRQVSFRMYPQGWRALVQGWTKNIAAGARRAPVAASVPAVAWVAALAAVAVATLGGLVSWAGGGDVPASALAAWLIVAAQLMVVLRRIGSFRAITALLFVVPLVCFLGVFARSALLIGRGATATWRGREVPVR